MGSKKNKMFCKEEVIGLISFWVSLPFSLAAVGAIVIGVIYVITLPFQSAPPSNAAGVLKSILYAGILGGGIQLSKVIAKRVQNHFSNAVTVENGTIDIDGGKKL